MKNTFLLISCLLWGSLHAQQLSEIARPVPAALCSEAPMPQDLAKKYARAEQARQNKFVTPQRETNSTIDSDLLLKRRTYLTAGKEAFTLACTPGEQYTFCAPRTCSVRRRTKCGSAARHSDWKSALLHALEPSFMLKSAHRPLC